jgi:glyoxylase-like metal-dependent hydrolase (beta-lactamase superfamily II)
MSMLFAAVALAAAASKAPAPPPKSIDVLPVQGNVYLLAGGSRNVVVQTGNEGVLYVDTSTADMSKPILDATRTLSKLPIRYVIDTHAHPENVGGNQALSRQGISFGGGNTKDQSFALILAHENVLNALSAPTGKQAALPSDFWPTDTYFTESMEVHFNGEPIELISVPAAHTDGDSLVHFRGSDVLVTGDVFLTTGYPIIDVEHGGTINGVIAALNRIIDIAIPRENQEDGTLIVPGQGRICDEYDVVVYRDMVTIVRDRVQDMIKKGMTLQQIQAARPSRDYDVLYTPGPGRATPEQFVAAVFQTLQGQRAAGTE